MMRKITSVTREYHCLMSSKFRAIAQEYGNWSPLERQHGHQHPLEGREHISRSSPIFRFVSSITSIHVLSNSSGLEPKNSTLDKNLLLQCNSPIKKIKGTITLSKGINHKKILNPVVPEECASRQKSRGKDSGLHDFRAGIRSFAPHKGQ